MLNSLPEKHRIVDMNSMEFNHFYAKHSDVNDDIYENFKYVSFRMEEGLLVLLKENTILGILAYQNDPKKENLLWGKTISIHQDYKGNGLAKYLVEHLFIKAQENNSSIQATSYSQQGFVRLRALVHDLKEHYNIGFSEPQQPHWIQAYGSEPIRRNPKF